MKNLSPNKLKILVSQLIFRKKITKIGEILPIENDPQKIGEKSFTKKSENFSESQKMSIKSHQNWRKFKGITKIGDNFVENQFRILYEFEGTFANPH